MRTLADEDPEKLRQVYRDLMEERAGKSLSAATTNQLTSVLDSLGVIDDATDDAMQILADLLGVSVPADEDEQQKNSGPTLELTRAKIARALLK